VGAVISIGSDIGGLIGNNASAPAINCYWDKETSGQTTSAGSEPFFGKTTAEMKTQATFTGWDFTTPVWGINPAYNSGYPYLSWQFSGSSAINDNLLPTETRLYNNYPNPFNPTTTIKFNLKSNSPVKLTVYNAKGELVNTLVNGLQNAGHHSVNFDGTGLNSGVYFYRLEAEGKCMVNKMIMIK
jgi:hypothetical protein